MQFDFPALGTHWWVEVFEPTNEQLDDSLKSAVVQFVSEFEARYSRFQPNSEISRLNRERVLENPSQETQELLGYSIDLYRRTRGVFNVMVGHILEARGYDGAYSFIDKGSAELQPGNPLTDLLISQDAIELRYGNIDIGGYGKGWCIDRVAELLQQRFGLQQFLINGGGDIYATHDHGQPIEIHLQHPITTELFASTTLKNQAFASSSPHLRRWPDSSTPGHHPDTEHTHIVTSDVKGVPLHIIRDTVYLTAPTATDADAFATTLLQVDDETAHDLTEQNNLKIL